MYWHKFGLTDIHSNFSDIYIQAIYKRNSHFKEAFMIVRSPITYFNPAKGIHIKMLLQKLIIKYVLFKL